MGRDREIELIRRWQRERDRQIEVRALEKMRAALGIAT